MRHPTTPRRGIRTIIAISAAGVAAALALAVPALACTVPRPGGGSRPVHPQPTCQWGSCGRTPTCGTGCGSTHTKPPACNDNCGSTHTKPPACNDNCGSTHTKPPACDNGCSPSRPAASRSSHGGGAGGGAVPSPSDTATSPTAPPTQPTTSSSGGDSLPVTGVDVAYLAGAGGVLLGTGVVVFYLARRRQVTFTT